MVYWYETSSTMTAFTVCSCVLFITEQKILDNSSNRNNICIIS